MPRLYIPIYNCQGILYFCYSCSRLKFVRAVNRSRCTFSGFELSLYRGIFMAPFWGRHSYMLIYIYIYSCSATLHFCWSCLRLKFARAVNRFRYTFSGFEVVLYKDNFMALFWGRYGCMLLYKKNSWAFYFCYSCLQLKLARAVNRLYCTFSGFELALYRDVLMALFRGCHSCMLLYLVFMVTLSFICLQPLLAFVYQPVGLKFRLGILLFNFSQNLAVASWSYFLLQHGVERTKRQSYDFSQ